MFVSEQLEASEVMLRVLASAADVSLRRILDGYLREKDFPSLTSAASKLAESRFEIMDKTPMSLESLSKRADEIKQGGALDLIIVDHLDSFASVRTARMDEREVALATATSTLRELARRLQIPVIFIATSRPPRIGREMASGGVDELSLDYVTRRDADVVATISIGSRYDEDEDMSAIQKATLTLVKNSFGVGEIPLHWNMDTVRFSDWETEEEISENDIVPARQSKSTKRKTR